MVAEGGCKCVPASTEVPYASGRVGQPMDGAVSQSVRRIENLGKRCGSKIDEGFLGDFRGVYREKLCALR